MKIKHTFTLYCLPFTLALFLVSCGTSGDGNGGESFEASDVSAANCADAAALNCFISQWDTTKTADGASYTNTIVLPLVENGEYDFYVDWGDETAIENITEFDAIEVTHTYAEEGEYTIHIAGEIKGWRFFVSEFNEEAGTDNDYGDAVKLLDVSQWGSLSLGNTAGGQFQGAANFNATASDAPNLSETTSLAAAFQNATVFDGAIGNWDVSTITTMESMFFNAAAFDQDLSDWDVSAVTTMNNMFQHTSNFNSPLVWENKTRNVTNMSYMFQSATLFNQDISGWNVGAVTNMRFMFFSATAFARDLSGWNVCNVNNNALFDAGAAATWTTAKKPNWGMDCPDGDNGGDGGDTGTDPITFADVSEANCADVDAGLSCFISVWNTENVPTDTTVTGYSGTMSVKLPLVSEGTYDFYVDWGDGEEVEKIEAYDALEVTHNYDESGTYTIHIAGTIKGWRFFVSEGTSPDTVSDYRDAVKLLDVSQWGSLSLGNTDGGQFYGAENFNPTATDAPDISETTSLHSAFSGASNFNGEIANWDVSKVTDMSRMFRYANKFNNNGKGLDWDDKTSKVTDTSYMFFDAGVFNQDISDWDLSKVTDMSFMFSGARSFNNNGKPLDWGAKTSKVTDMKDMFNGASVFNQAIGDWKVSEVTSMNTMFWDASVFNQDICYWNVGNVGPFSSLDFAKGSALDNKNNPFEAECTARKSN